jgi:hypothetical protein
MDVFSFRDRPRRRESGIEGTFIDSDRNGTTLAADLHSGSRLGSAGIEVFMLSGKLISEGQILGPLDYAILAEPAEVIQTGLAIVWVPRGATTAAARIEPAAGAEWRAPALGSTAGMFFRSLRREEHVDVIDGRRVTGTERGFRRLTTLTPGWREPRCEVHPGCREENILLAGDLFVAGHGRGAIHPGGVLVNEVGLRHGPMATRGGAVILISCDYWMAVDWSDAPEEELESMNLYLGEGFPLSAT